MRRDEIDAERADLTVSLSQPARLSFAVWCVWVYYTWPDDHIGLESACTGFSARSATRHARRRMKRDLRSFGAASRRGAW